MLAHLKCFRFHSFMVSSVVVTQVRWKTTCLKISEEWGFAHILVWPLYCIIVYIPSVKAEPVPWLIVQRINSSSVSGTGTLIKPHTLPPMKTLAAARQKGAKAYRPFCKGCSKHWTLNSIPCIYSCTGVYPGCRTVNPFCQQTTKVINAGIMVSKPPGFTFHCTF